MRRVLVFLAASALSAVLVCIPLNVAPAQAADTVRSLAPCPPLSSLCTPQGVAVITALGVTSAAGTTAATAATAGVVATGLGGTAGFWTVVGAGVVATAMMTVKGIEEGVFLKTDPAYVGAVADAGWSGGDQLFETTTTFEAKPVVLKLTVVSAPAYGAKGTQSVVLRADMVSYACPTTTNKGITASAAAWLRAGASSSGLSPISLPSLTGLCNFTSAPYPATVTLTYDHGTTYGFGGFSIQVGSTPVMTWLPEGAPDRPPGLLPGYHGTIRTTVQCKTAAATTPVMTERRVDVDQGDDLDMPPASCAAGIAVSSKFEYRADGSSTWIELGAGTAPTAVQNYDTDYPGCFASSQGSTCTLELERKDGTRWETCGPLANYCPGWVEEWVETPEVYRCKFGDYAVSIDLCSAFRKPGTLLPNHETPDPGEQPTPLPPTAPEPSPLPNPVLTPGGTPLETPPWVDVDGAGNPDAQARECWPSGWGVLNPLAWVFMPVKCALEDAFIPRASKIQEFKTRVSDAWGSSSIGATGNSIVVGIESVGGGLDDAGCNGVYVPTGWLNMGGLTGIPDGFRIMQACPGDPLKPYADFASVMIAAGMVVLCFKTWPALLGRMVTYGGIDGN